MSRQQLPAWKVRLPRKTYDEVVRNFTAWEQVYSQPGAVFLPGSFSVTASQPRNSNTAGGLFGMRVLKPAGVAAVLRNVLAVLRNARLTKAHAVIDLQVSAEEIEDLYWAAMHCETKSRMQKRALNRVAAEVLRYERRPPLMKLADAAE